LIFLTIVIFSKGDNSTIISTSKSEGLLRNMIHWKHRWMKSYIHVSLAIITNIDGDCIVGDIHTGRKKISNEKEM